MTTEKRAMSVRKRLDDVEGNLSHVVKDFNTAFGNLAKQLSEAVETLNACVAHIGVEKVADLVLSERQARAAEQAEKNKAHISKLVADGLLVAGDKVGDQSVIIGEETDSEGKVIPPGYVQLHFPTINPEFQAKFRGESVGFSTENGGGKFRIVAIWEQATPTVAKEPSETPVAKE